MPSLFDVLGHDHDEVRQPLAGLEAGPDGVTGADGSDLARQKKLVEQVRGARSGPQLRTALSAEETSELSGKIEQAKRPRRHARTHTRQTPGGPEGGRGGRRGGRPGPDAAAGRGRISGSRGLRIHHGPPQATERKEGKR